MNKGILYMAISSLCFAFVNTLVKFLTGDFGAELGLQNYPPFEIVFFRSIISLTISSVIIFNKKIPFFGHNKPWLLIRGLFGASALTLFFFTLKNLPMAVAVTIQYMSPIFTVIFSIFLLHEKVKWQQWLFFLVSFIGVVIIGLGKYLSDSNTPFNPIWIFAGLISATLAGVAYNAIIKLNKTEDPITIVMYFPLMATPVMILIMAITGEYVIPKGVEWILLLFIGVFTQFAQIFMTKSFQFGPAVKVAPLKYLGSIYALLIGFFVFDESLKTFSLFGIGFILMGLILNTFYKSKPKQS